MQTVTIYMEKYSPTHWGTQPSGQRLGGTITYYLADESKVVSTFSIGSAVPGTEPRERQITADFTDKPSPVLYCDATYYINYGGVVVGYTVTIIRV